MTKCFISHAWSDGGHDFALALKDALYTNGVDAWLDEHELHGGEPLEQEVRIAILYECDVFLFVLSPAALKSRWCAVELKEALKCRDESGLQIIPIFFKKCKIPAELKDLVYEPFRDRARFHESVERLLPAIEAASRIRTQIAKLSDGDHHARSKATQHLARLRNPFVVPILARCLDSDPNPTVRQWLAYALGQIGGEEACAALRVACGKETNLFARLGIEDALKEACGPVP